MRRFCWRERSEKLNWRLLGALDVANVVRQGDPVVLEPYALHITFARLPNSTKDPATRDAWFLVRVLQLAMEYLLFMRARDGDVLESLSQELRQVEKERDELVVRAQKWKARAHSGDKQVEKLHQVLQNIAKLLQIHGASPSAVVTIETLLTELISERRAKQKRRALMEKEEDETEEEMRPAVQEARVCGFCGKLFSSAEYLEIHLVRRHGRENIGVETPVKHKMRRGFRDVVEHKENQMKSEDTAVSESAMQKMVQQVERALHEHEEKLRSLAEEEAEKVKQIYERLHTETKLAEEMKTTRLKSEQQHEDSQRQLDEICLQKQKAQDELADLKQQIQFLTLKKKMMAANVVLRSSLPHKDDNALIAADEEIKNLHQTLETVNAELTSAREELTKVQALHLSALRKKKELADKLALSCEASATVQQDYSSQTVQPAMVNETVQTDELTCPLLIESEPSAPIRVDVGTDPLNLTYEDASIQTVDVFQAPLINSEVQVSIIDDPVPAHAPELSPVVPESITQGSGTGDAGSGTDEVVSEDAVSPIQKDDERIPDYIQQIHSQGLLDAIDERAQSAASKAASSDLPAQRNYSSIPRHKYVRSRFLHDENVVKGRVASCLSQLELFSRRFGVPAKSAWLSEDNLQIVQQALHGHLEVLPAEVLSRMVDCENAVNALIEKKWVPMERTRQEALERFKVETRAKSEISQGLVRQAMAAFGASLKTSQPTDVAKSEVVVAVSGEKSPIAEEQPAERNLAEEESQKSTTDIKDDSGTTSARRYSANNQLTVVVGGEVTEGTAYLVDEFTEGKISSPRDDFAVADTEVEEKANPSEVQEAVHYLVESLHLDDASLNPEDKSAEPIAESSAAGSLQWRDDENTTTSPSLGGSQEAVVRVSTGDLELPQVAETTVPRENSTPQIKLISVDTAMDGRRRSSWETTSLTRSHSGELVAAKLSSTQDQKVVSVQRNIDDNRTKWQDEEQEVRSQWNLPRVGSSSADLGAPQVRISEHPALLRTRSDHFESASSPQPTDSFQSDRLSAGSEFADIEPATGLDPTQSIVMSEMSFGMSIPSLGEESDSVEASTSAVVMGLVDTIDSKGEAEDAEGSTPSPASAPAVTTRDVQNDSVMSFDDSDIEEVVLT